MNLSNSEWPPGGGVAPAGDEERGLVNGLAMVFSVLATAGSGVAVVAWMADHGKQAPCPPSESVLFNIQVVCLVASSLLLVVGLLAFAATLRRKKSRVALDWVLLIATFFVGFVSVQLIIGAVVFHHGGVSNCLA